MINRMANQECATVKQIIEDAVRDSRTPGTPTPGATPSTGVVDSLIPTTTPDADGNTLYTALTEIDTTDNPFARTE